MKILIVEDEPVSANELQLLIAQKEPMAHILPLVDTIDQAVLMLGSNSPDLMFLDIELADGSAFEIFEEVEVKCPIIFTTAYSEYAIEAFEHNSVAYLLKPITKEKIDKAFADYVNMKAIFDFGQVKDVIRSIQEAPVHSIYKEGFLVKFGNKLLPIKSVDIAYFFAEDKWVYLITKQNKKYLVNYTLNQLEEVLNPQLFFRLNRQFLITSGVIHTLEPYVKGQVMANLTMGLKPQAVSRRQTRALKAWLS